MFHVKQEAETGMNTVAIPADVKDNSPHTVRIQWRSTAPEELTDDDLARARTTFGYTVHQWDDTDKGGTRVRLTRMDKDGRSVWLYATYFYTRVPCTDCEYSWAAYYLQVTDADGVTHPAAPFCDTHADVVRKITRRQPGYTLAESEPLIIGQH